MQIIDNCLVVVMCWDGWIGRGGTGEGVGGGGGGCCERLVLRVRKKVSQLQASWIFQSKLREVGGSNKDSQGI